MIVYWSVLALASAVVLGSLFKRSLFARYRVHGCILFLLISVGIYTRMPLWQYAFIWMAMGLLLLSVAMSGFKRYVATGLAAFCLVLGAASGYLFPLFQGSPPGGEHPVGYAVHYQNVPADGIHAQGGTAGRVAPVKVWFPAAYPGDQRVSLEDTAHGLKAKYWYIPVLPRLLDNLSLSFSSATNAQQPIAGRLPAVVYNHGGGCYPEDNHVMMEKLASHGYVVVSIGHPLSTSSIKYPDGYIVRADFEAYGRTEISVEDQVRLNTNYDRAMVADTYDEYFELISEYVMTPDPSELLVADWVADTMSIVENLATLPVVGEQIDPERLVFMGYSLGGATSVEVCRRFPGNCAALINLDGLPVRSQGVTTQDLGKPILLISGEDGLEGRHTHSPGEFIVRNNSGTSYNIEIRGSTHGQFSSEGYYSPVFNMGQRLGQHAATQQAVLEIVLGFLDRHLRGLPDATLPAPSVEIVRYPD